MTLNALDTALVELAAASTPDTALAKLEWRLQRAFVSWDVPAAEEVV